MIKYIKNCDTCIFLESRDNHCKLTERKWPESQIPTLTLMFSTPEWCPLKNQYVTFKLINNSIKNKVKKQAVNVTEDQKYSFLMENKKLADEVFKNISVNTKENKLLINKIRDKFGYSKKTYYFGILRSFANTWGKLD